MNRWKLLTVKRFSFGMLLIAFFVLICGEVSAREPIITYYDTGNMKTKEIESETDVAEDDELYLKHVKYVYFDEDAGSGYGRVSQVRVYDVDPVVLDFDGVNDYVDCGNDSSLNITGQITVEAWIKGEPQKMNTVAGKYDWKTNDRSWVLRTGYGDYSKFQVLLSDDGTFGVGHVKYYESSVTVFDETWHHVAFTFDGTDLKLYVDGQEDASVTKLKDYTLSGLYNSSSNMTIGAQLMSGLPWDFFQGDIKDVGIYNRALAGNEVDARYDNVDISTGLVARYKTDDAWGPVLKDAAGSNAGKIVGAKWDGPDREAPSFLRFDGTNDNVNCGNDASLDITEDVTVAIWIKGDSQTQKGIVSKYDYSGNDRSWTLRSGVYHPGKFQVLLSDNGTYSAGHNKYYESSKVVFDDTWHQLVFTFDGSASALKLYVDGVEDTNVNRIRNDGITGLFASSTDMSIGAQIISGVAASFFEGEIKDIRLYESTFTAGEVKGMYNGEYPASGLVSSWLFDEGQGAVLGDGTGDNDGSIVGAVWTNDKPPVEEDISLKLDGVNDYVDCGNDPSLDITGQITVETWVKGEAQKMNAIAGKYDWQANDRSWILRTGYGDYSKFQVIISDDGTYGAGHVKYYESSITVFDDTWHHIAFTFDGADLRLYIDGTEDTNITKIKDASITNLYDSSVNMTIGAQFVSGLAWDFFQGQVKDVNVYDRALTSGEIGDSYGGTEITNNLVANYKCDNGWGPVLKDHKGTNAGTIYGGGWRGIDLPQPSFLGFDGGADYVNCGNDASLDITEDITVELWIKGTEQQQQGIVSKYDYSGNDRSWTLRSGVYHPGKFQVLLSDNGTYSAGHNKYYESSKVVFDDTWHHLVFTFDGSESLLKFYIDGKEDTGINEIRDDSITGLHVSSADLAIGAQIIGGTPAEFFEGRIKAVRIYDRALLFDEVKGMYNGDHTTTGLVSNWLFEEGEGATLGDGTGDNDGTITGATWLGGETDGNWYYDIVYADPGDPLDNIMETKTRRDLLTDEMIVTYAYYTDAENRLRSKTLAEEDEYGFVYYEYRNESFYDDLGRIIKVQRSDNSYDLFNEYWERTSDNPDLTTDNMKTKEVYDTNGDLLNRYGYWWDGTTVLSQIDYATGQIDIWPGGDIYRKLLWEGDAYHAYTYDDGHLIMENDPDEGVKVYEYDGAWNLAGYTRTYQTGGSPPRVKEVYDGDGNLTTKYEWGEEFYAGVNLAWLDYGKDIGMSHADNRPPVQRGFSTKRDELDAKFRDLSGSICRVFLFCDLRSGIELDGEGNITGFDEQAASDLIELLTAAEANGVELILTLFDYTIADGITGVKYDPGGGEITEQLGEYPQFIEDDTKRAQLVDTVQDLFEKVNLDLFDCVAGFDVMNEPAWARDGIEYGEHPDEYVYDPAWTSGGISTEELQTFVGDFYDMLSDAYPESFVTVGAKDRNEMLDNWSSDLDAYQYHYYNWMEDPDGYGPDGRQLDVSAGSLGLDSWIFAGELEPDDFEEKLAALYSNGYSAGLFWQDTDSYSISDEELAEILNWFFGTMYEYYADVDNRMKSQTFSEKDGSDNVYYRYMNEDWQEQGYGRMDVSQLAEANEDGEIAFEYEYYDGEYSSQVHYKRSYTDVGRETLYGTYEYNTSGGLTGFTLAENTEYYDGTGRVKRVYNPDGTITEYFDEADGRKALESSYTNATLYGSYSTDNWYAAYEWDIVSQGIVLVKKHDGDYTVTAGSDIKAGVYTSEKRVVYVYEHNGVYTTYDESWVYTGQVIYENNGEDIDDFYEYYNDGTRDIPGHLKRQKDFGFEGKEWEYNGSDVYRQIVYASYDGNGTKTLYDDYTTDNCYTVFDWDSFPDQLVLTDIYDGDYSVWAFDPLKSDVYTTERRVRYYYYTNGSYTTYDEENWVYGGQLVYENDGVTREKYKEYYDNGTYASHGYLRREIYFGLDAEEWYYNSPSTYWQVLYASYEDRGTKTLYGSYTTDNAYTTFDWEESPGQMAVLSMHDGEYTVDAFDDLLSGVYTNQRRVKYYYYTNGSYTSYDEDNWIYGGQLIYEDDGVTGSEYREYYDNGTYTTGGQLIRQFDFDTDGSEWYYNGSDIYRKVLYASYDGSGTKTLYEGYTTDNAYTTFNWDVAPDTMVMLTMYDGEYSVEPFSDAWSGTYTSERRVDYYYYTNGSYTTYDEDNWIYGGQLIYENDGITERDRYEYYNDGTYTEGGQLRRQVDYGTEAKEWYYNGPGTYRQELYASYEGSGIKTLYGDYSTDTSYNTFDWTTFEGHQDEKVIVTMHDGTYEADVFSDLWSGVHTTDRRVSYYYYTDGSYTTYDEDNWVYGGQLIYEHDGVTRDTYYEFYGNGTFTTGGHLSRQFDFGAEGNEWYYDGASTYQKVLYASYEENGVKELYGGYTTDNSYTKFIWDMAPGELVVTEMYDGEYDVDPFTATWSGAYTSERRVMYIYYTNGSYTTYDQANWVYGAQLVYEDDGVTEKTYQEYYDDGTFSSGGHLRIQVEFGIDGSEWYYDEGQDIYVQVTYASYAGNGTKELYGGYTTDTSYATYDWETLQLDDQVIVTKYDGVYTVEDAFDDLWSGAYTSHRRVEYVYDHNDNFNIDQAGWVIREQTIYDTDGETEIKGYDWDEYGRLTGEFYADTDREYYYEYFDVGGAYSTKYSYKEEYTCDSEDALFAYWYFENDDNRIKQKLEVEDEKAYQYYNQGQDVGGQSGWYREIQWDADYSSGKHGDMYGFDNDDADDPTPLWQQFDASEDGNIDSMYTLEYYPSENRHWANEYTWTGSAWVYVNSHEHTDTDPPVYFSSEYRASRPDEPPYPDDIPEKPEFQYSGSTSLDEADISDADHISSCDALIPEEMKAFFDKLDAIRSDAQGEGILVALLDSGIDAEKLDINISGGYDFASSNRFDGRTDTDWADSTGHGTETAMVLTATAPQADVLAVKVLDDHGRTTSNVTAEAIRYAVDTGARILAIPFNLMPVSSVVTDAISYAADNDVLLIASAGNDGSEMEDTSFASQEEVIAVGSVENDGALSAWSNYGEEVDLYAPWDIIGNDSGTSFSAAFVAGIAALVISENSDMSQEEVLGELKTLLAGFERTETDIQDKIEDEVLSKQEALLKSRKNFNGQQIKIEELFSPDK